MKENRKTAGKTATKNEHSDEAATKNGSAQGAANTAKGSGRWRTTTRKGERVLIDHDGHIYHGTAQEVRDAALSPDRRKGLLQSIEWAKHTAEKFNYTPEQKAEYIREKRREAIRDNEHDLYFGESIHIPQDVYILLQAAARYMGQTFDDLISEAVYAAIDATIDKVKSDTGADGLPLTRYERAALDRIKATKAEVAERRKARREKWQAQQEAKLAKTRATA